jgi:hypothetical protein
MSLFKAKIDFRGYIAAKLGPVAVAIHDGMSKSAAMFPTPPVTMAELQTEIEDYETKLAARASRDSGAVLAFNDARHALETMLAALGGYVNGVAKGDPVIINASGFPYYDASSNRPDTAPPAAPDGVALRHGDLSGTVVARYHPLRSPSMNEAQTCTGDPNVETNWQPAGMFSGGKATLAGLTPGATVWVRFRTAGIKGVMGAWSDPAKIMVV